MEIKSWHIAAISVIIQIVVSADLFLTFYNVPPMQDVFLESLRPTGVMLTYASFIAIGILLIPATLLKKNKTEKVGAIIAAILGLMGVASGIEMWPLLEYAAGIFEMFEILCIFGFFQGIFLLLAGTYYFWKKKS